MKLKLCVICLLLTFYGTQASADNAGLHYINTRGVVRCGTPADNKIFAYKDDEGTWQGISVEVCRIISTAVFGRSDRIKMVQVPETLISKALETGKIDVMIGGLPYSATNEISTKAAPVDVVYYDRTVFLARDPGNAKSMKDFKGEKVCVVQDTDNLSRIETYNDRYNLEFKIMPYKTASQAKENFLLKRCRLFVGNSMLLQDMIFSTPAGLSGVEMLPETVDERPFYLFALKSNTTLRTTLKWIMNAVKLAEELDLNKDNYQLNIASRDPTTRNLLGGDEKLWKRFKLEPNWVQILLKERGNYGDIYNRAFGENSRFKLERGANNLQKNGGKIKTEPFL